MGAFDILDHLRRRGVLLAPEASGRHILVTHGGNLTEADRDQIRANKPALLALLRRPQTAPAVRLLCGLDDAEIAQMVQRVNVARRHGYSLDDAEVIADRLLMRDRTRLDMCACLECARLSGRRCIARAVQSFDPRDAHTLRRCPAFTAITKD